MKQNKKVLLNVVSSGVQVALIGIVYFLLYRFLIKQLSIEILGVWSVVLATSSLANLANFGIATSVVRYVALYNSEKDFEKIKRLVFTASLFLLGLFLTLSLIILPFAGLLLRAIIDKKYVGVALEILPYSLVCLIINSVAGVYASVLDGLQKNYIRNIIFTVSSVLLLLGSYYWASRLGLKGVAFAQVLQSLFSLLACLILVIKIIGFNPLQFSWDKLIFRDIFSYGMKFQFLSLTAMLQEPITKSLMAKFGGLAFTGYYEMANRLINQIRGVIVNAVQSLLPVMVDLSQKDNDKHENLYVNTMIIVGLVSLIFLVFLLCISNSISLFWIGHIEPVFIVALMFLAISVFTNLLCSPAYFSNIADGKLRNPVFSQLIMAIINTIAGYALGYFFGGFGVLLGWVLAVCTGSIYLTYLYQQINNIPIDQVFKRDMIYFFIMLLLLLLIKHFFNSVNYYLADATGLVILTAMVSFKIYTIYKERKIYFR